jgi:hypothetical protein
MRTSLPRTVLTFAGLVLACGVEGPTTPTELEQPTIEEATGLPGAVLTTTTVIDQAGDVGRFTSLASGSDGRQHVAYFDATKADLRYATCASGCGAASNWSRGVIDQMGSVGYQSSLEVGSDGRRHVTYRDESNRDLKYAHCAPTANCSVTANWKKVRVDAGDDAGRGSALALGTNGQRHVSYYRLRVGQTGETMALRYATCSSGCGQAANWTKVTIEETPNSTAAPPGLLASSIAIGPDGRRHISYLNAGGSDLRYATCPSNCANPTNWRRVTIDESAQKIGFSSSLAAGQDGVLHVSYYDYSNGDLLYARCALNCWQASSWKKVRVATTNEVGSYTSLALEPNGRVHISALEFTEEGLYYATCAAGCTVPGSWTGAVLDGAISHVGWYTSITVRSGVVRVTYYDRGHGDLKYLTRAQLSNPF